jgi:prepilin signal peptidase PulO-like enzyme (type II secretory pathway)
MFFWLIVSIVFGLLFGSFWSVILSRWAKSENINQSLSIIFWRSECPNCKTTLQARDLIPLISFLIQWWRCRYCKRKISWFYPVLELGSALIFWFAWRYCQSQWIWVTIFWMATGWVLWLMVVYSVLWYEIHIPLLLIWFSILLIGMWKWLFSRECLRWWVVLFCVFLMLYCMARQLVKIRYHIKEDGMWIWDILTSPYLWTLLFIWLWNDFWVLDKTLAILYFLIFSGIIWIIRYFLQSAQNKKRARRFLNTKIANQSLPMLPSTVLAVIVIVLFKDVLFWTFIF